MSVKILHHMRGLLDRPDFVCIYAAFHREMCNMPCIDFERRFIGPAAGSLRRIRDEARFIRFRSTKFGE